MKNRIWKTTGVVLATVCSLLIGSGNRIQGAEAGNYGYEAIAVQDEEQGTGNSSEDFEIKATLSNTTPETPEVLGEFEIELKGFFELDKTTITSNWNNNWQLNYVANYSESAGISFEYLFKASKGNPYGADDGSGFLEFADNTEKINALTWCLSNNSGEYNDSMTNKFDIVTSFYYDVISESFNISVFILFVFTIAQI